MIDSAGGFLQSTFILKTASDVLIDGLGKHQAYQMVTVLAFCEGEVWRREGCGGGRGVAKGGVWREGTGHSLMPWPRPRVGNLFMLDGRSI